MSRKRGRHQSLSKVLDVSVRWLEARDDVRKVILGRTESCRHAYPPGHLRVRRPTDAGLHVNGYSGNGVVDLFVVTDSGDRDPIAAAIADRFPP